MSGVAMATALSAMVPGSRSQKDTQFTMGVGYYEGYSAGAVGAFHYVNDDTYINAGASIGEGGRSAVRAGIAFGF